MYKRMLIPLDGSEVAEVALNYAKNLVCDLTGIEVFLLHVYSPDERGLVPKHRAYVERAADSIVRYSEKAQSSARVVKAQCELAMGNPAEEILRYADRNGIDLILMATHGRSGVNRWAMGSIAYKVLRASKVPIWLVRAGIPEEIIKDKLTIRTILVPLDGSKLAEAVLPHIETLAKQCADGQVEVVLLRVCQPPDVSSDYPPSMPASWEEHVELEMAKCKLEAGPYLVEIGKRFREAGLKVRQEVPLGKPAKAIIDYALSNRISLIAMITHGRSGISRWAYGSITEEVMIGALTPVLLVRSR